MTKRLSRWIDVIGKYQFRPAEVDPIIVLGNQKSGTSAIASLLAKATGMSFVIDIPEFWGDKFKRLHAGQSSLVSAIRACYRQFSLDLVKEPNLTFLFPELQRVLPRAKFVFIVRDPTQNVRSIAERLKFSQNDLMAGSERAQSLSEGWRGVFDDPYLYGPDSIHRTCGEILAIRWKVAARVFLRSPDEFKLIRFEDFVSNKVGSIKQLADRLDLEVKYDISSQIDIAFQPAGKQRLVVPDRLVATFPEILGAEAAQLGYAVAPAVHRARSA